MKKKKCRLECGVSPLAFLCHAFRKVVIGVLGSLALVAGGQDAVAADRVLLGRTAGAALRSSSDATIVETLTALREKAAKYGAARVIVGVRAAFAPEGQLSAAAVKTQREEIAMIQSAVQGRLAPLKSASSTVRRYAYIPFMAMEVTAAELEMLAVLPEVTSIDEDRRSESHLAESVPVLGGSAAWNFGYTGAGRTIAVLDTGVDKTHPSLAGKVVSEACYSSGNFLMGTKSLCPGFWDSSTDPDSAMPYLSGDCPAGKCDHGTHVAGIAAGNGGGLSGVAKDASLIAIQVFHREDDCSPDPSPCVSSYTSDQLDGLNRVYALRNSYDIAAVNMSLGGGQYSNQGTCDSDGSNAALKAAIDNLRSANIATVISSGNDGYTNSMSAPACISSAISVGATWDAPGQSRTFSTVPCSDSDTTLDQIACYSNSSSFLNLLAPGSAITSSIPGGTEALHGTSMAAPHVAGAWALLKQKNTGLTVTQGLAALNAAGTGALVTDARNGIQKRRIGIDGALASIVRNNFIFSGDVVNRGNVPISGAQVYFVVDGQSFSGATDGAGHFSYAFDPTNMPSTVVFWVVKSGYIPFSGNLPLSGGSANAGTLTLELANASTVVLEVVPDVHHLGDSNYGGTINSGFQKPDAEGLTYSRSFDLSAAQDAATAATVTLLAKGLQDQNRLLVNNQLVGYLNTSPADGSFGAISFPVSMSVLVPGPNTLTIESAASFDYDDFEFTNVSLILTGVAIPGAPSAPSIGIANAGNARIDVAFSPGALGSGTLFDFTAECSSASAASTTRRGIGSPITVTGLTNGASYTCRVRATTTVGDSPWSLASNAVTPSFPDDGFPGGSGLPVGWTQPAGSNASWVVSAGVAYAGGQSLKSGIIGNSQKSDLSFTATFLAGNVSFARKVSSESNYDFLEFFVDGVLKASWSGEVNWGVVSVPISAGSHTLLWRYRKDGSATSGSDAAWIDKVVLPTVGASYPLTVTATGGGTVTSNPAGITCGATCNAGFFNGASVVLTALPAAGNAFAGWSGACTGIGSCNVSMTSARSVGATFTAATGDTDGDGIPDGVEVLEERNPLAKDNDIFSSSAVAARLFAMQQYRDFLGREGDAGGIAYYTDLVTFGIATRANVIESFFNSPEFSGTVSPIVRLYFATFLRIPDYPGLQFQVNAFRTGTPLTVIANNFSASPEFQARYGALTNAQYVTLLYQNVLGRTPAPPEVDFHVARLESGATRGEVMVGFSESPEFRANTSNDVYVTMMYVGMLRRAPEQAGFDYWLAYMDGGNPGINLILGFLNAPEYRARFLP